LPAIFDVNGLPPGDVIVPVHLSFMRTVFCFLLFLLMIALLSRPSNAAAPPANEWMVFLEEPPVVERFPGRIEQTRAASEPYRQHLRQVQQAIRTQIESMRIPVTGAVQHLLNGIFVRATPTQAARLRSLSGVSAVIPLRRYHLSDQLSLSNVEQAWGNSAIGGQGNAGKGLKIAVIDTGIDQTHPSFQDSSLTPPAGFPKCDVASNCAFTNNKVIVARSYVSTLTAGSNPSNPAADDRPDDLSARDFDGHGTSVSSVAAGVPSTVGSTSISGVAPKAFLGNYKIFGSPEVNNGASDAGIIRALDDAVTDGMDVVNLSSGAPPFGGPLDTGAICGEPAGVPCDPSAAAVENAMRNGQVIVAVSAGNSGSTGYQSITNGVATYGTVASPAYTPSAIAAGGIQNDVTYARSIAITGSGVPANLAALNGFSGGGVPVPTAPLTAPLVDVTQIGANTLLCAAPAAGSLNGDIALISRGTCDFINKITNAASAGAVGVIIFNDVTDLSILTSWGAPGASIPAYMISQSDGQNLQSFVDGITGVTATLNPTLVQIPASAAGFIPDSTAYFASRGPATGSYGLKPDVSAVATDFLLAAESIDPFGDLFSSTRYATAAGTSFSSPMLAGASALVKQVNPNLTPLQVKSALVNSATLTGVLNQAGTGPAGVSDNGSGLLQAQNAVVSPVQFVPSTVSFGLLSGSLPPSQTLTVSNASASSLTLSFGVTPTLGATAAAVRINNSSNPSVTLAAGQSSSIAVSLSGPVPPAGRYEGLITVSGAGTPLQIPYMFLVASNTPYDMIPLLGDGFDGPIDQEIPADLGGGIAIRIIDQYGAAVPGAAVHWAAVEGGGRVLSGPQYTDASTDPNGIAYATVVLGPTIGAQQFSATVAGGISYTFTGNGRLTPTINAGGIVDGASFTTGRAVAPGSIVSIFGENLSDFTASASQLPLPLGIDGVAFSFDVVSAGVSLPAHFFYVSPTQINLQIPWELADFSSATVKTYINFTYGAEYTLNLATYSPGFFAYQSNGQTLAAALDSANNLVSSGNPVAQGSTVQLFLNGLGPVNNQPADGWAATDASSTTMATPSIAIGGLPATVSFSGLAPNFVGLYQVNAVVPTGIGAGLQLLTCSTGGVTCQTVSLNVK
jgi:minor extracellular serine protease Vpr